MSRLGRNILYNAGGQTLVLAIGFVAVRLIYRDLGEDAVGLIFFSLTLSSVIAGAMDLGISSTIVREVAAHAGRRPEYTNRLVSTATLFYWATYLVLVVLVSLGAGTIARHWLNFGSLDPAIAETSLRTLGFGSLLALPRSLYASLFRGLQRMGVINTIDVASTALQQAGLVATVGLGGGIVAVSSWFTASAVIGLVAYVVAASRVVSPRALWPRLDTEILRTNQSYASRMTIVSALAMVHTHADKLIVSRLLPLGLFGLYGFGFNTVNKGMLVTGAASQAAFPSLSELHSQGNRQALLEQYRRLQDLVSFGTAAVFAAVPFAVPPVFSVLFGPSEAARMLVPCTLLAVGFYMNSTLNMPYMLSLAMGKPGIAMSLNAWALVVVLPITGGAVWLWGLTGAGLSWVLYHVFAYAYAIPRICKECADDGIGRWYLDVAKFCVPAGLIYGFVWFLAMTTGSSTASYAFAYVGGTVCYSVAGWRMLPTDVRDRIGRCFEAPPRPSDGGN
jgi:O-antigen/teichoic acid export membrane protein